MININRIILRTGWLSGIQQHTFQKFRGMYSSVSLGMVEYKNVRDRYKNVNTNILQSFRKKMEEITQDENSSNLVFSDDLKQLVHIVENDNDIKLFEILLSKFNKQHVKLRFGQFVFGPVIMRMYHYMNKPKEALRACMNPEFDGLFDELSSHILLLDLLFKNGMYQEIVDAYKITREKQYSFGKHAKTILLPLFGALYKLNTEESYRYMLDLLQEMQEAGHVPVRRIICFAAALALKQNNPQVALELVEPIENQGFFLIRSIKALSTCALNQIDETLIILASVLTIDTPTKNNHTFPKDVINTVKNHIEKSHRKDHIIEFKRVEKQLIDFNHIIEKTLDDLLCSEFTIFNPVNKMKKVISASLDETPYGTKKYQRILRPGLQEML